MREPQLPHLLLFAYIHAARVKLFTQPGGVAEEDDGVEPDALRALGIRGRVVNEHALRAVQTELFKRAFKERRIGLEEMHVRRAVHALLREVLAGAGPRS